jgi:hypothetical protein
MNIHRTERKHKLCAGKQKLLADWSILGGQINHWPASTRSHTMLRLLAKEQEENIIPLKRVTPFVHILHSTKMHQKHPNHYEKTANKCE